MGSCWGQACAIVLLCRVVYPHRMARKPRIHVPGGVYHVMLRGNGGQDIFTDDDDYYHLYLLLQEGLERYGHRIHGFCCMTNHIHLAIQVADEPLSKIMQNLSFRYTRWINKKQERTGHLFQGRYKAILVDQNSYLLELIRYIHLNPVRAGLVKDPADYPWSGHLAYLGVESIPWLHTDWILGQFAKRVSTCQSRYATFVQEGVREGHRSDFHHGGEDSRVLADDRFLERVTGKKAPSIPKITLNEIVACVLKDYEVKVDEVRSASRNRQLSEIRVLIGWIAIQLKAASVKEVADYFQRDASTFSRHVAIVESKREKSKKFKYRLNQYINTLTQA